MNSAETFPQRMLHKVEPGAVATGSDRILSPIDFKKIKVAVKEFAETNPVATAPVRVFRGHHLVLLSG